MRTENASGKRTPASHLVCESLPIGYDTSNNILLGALGRKLGEMWKNLSDEERKPYEDKAAADKKRYEDEKAQYAVSPPACRSLYWSFLTRILAVGRRRR